MREESVFPDVDDEGRLLPVDLLLLGPADGLVFLTVISHLYSALMDETRFRSMALAGRDALTV